MQRRVVIVISLMLISGCTAPQPLPLGNQPSGNSPLFRRTATSATPITQQTVVPELTRTPQPVLAVPTELPAPSTPTTAVMPISTPTPEVIIIPAPLEQSSEARWRAQQIDREVINPVRLYETSAPTQLLWYDPATGQVLEIGSLHGAFPVQAQFTFRPTRASALEVPYRINNDFGLTSISDALLTRMQHSGSDQYVEAFVLLTDAIKPRP